MGEKVVWQGHPAWFRQRPGAFVFNGILVFAGGCLLPFTLGWSWPLPVGLAILVGLLALRFVVWWLASVATTLTVTSYRTTCRSGILSRKTSEVRHIDVRNLQVNQTLFQRIMGTGSIGISSAGQGGVEIFVAGILDPERVASIIRGYQAGAGNSP